MDTGKKEYTRGDLNGLKFYVLSNYKTVYTIIDDSLTEDPIVVLNLEGEEVGGWNVRTVLEHLNSGIWKISKSYKVGDLHGLKFCVSHVPSYSYYIEDLNLLENGQIRIFWDNEEKGYAHNWTIDSALSALNTGLWKEIK